MTKYACDIHVGYKTARSIRGTDGRIDGGAFVRIRMRRVRISRNIDDLIRSMRPKLFKTLRLASSSVPLYPPDHFMPSLVVMYYLAFNLTVESNVGLRQCRCTVYEERATFEKL